MVTGKTKSGFKYAIDERVFKDWRLMNWLRKLMNKEKEGDNVESMDYLFNILEFVMGDKMDAYIEHVASKNDGYVDFELVSAEIMEIITSNNESKN